MRTTASGRHAAKKGRSLSGRALSTPTCDPGFHFAPKRTDVQVDREQIRQPMAPFTEHVPASRPWAPATRFEKVVQGDRDDACSGTGSHCGCRSCSWNRNDCCGTGPDRNMTGASITELRSSSLPRIGSIRFGARAHAALNTSSRQSDRSCHGDRSS
jgi:hypothetical protein